MTGQSMNGGGAGGSVVVAAALPEDPALPTLRDALDPERADGLFRHGLPRLAGPDGRVILRSARLVRHKVGKRAVIEYCVRIRKPDGSQAKAVLVGKIRANRSGNEGYRLLDALWRAGFQADSDDLISVPEPIGVLPELRMWLQRRVDGNESWSKLAGPGGAKWGRRIVNGLHKLHRAGVTVERTHTIDDELRILRECLGRAAAACPELASRIERLSESCERAARAVPAVSPCGIHRDFYPSQVLVRHPRLWLIDFDLYCLGDPALDVGNFIGHGLEEALRTRGAAEAWAEPESAMAERFADLNGPEARRAVRVYTALTLARHVYLTTQFRERLPFTPAILALAENRLAEIVAGS